MFLCYLPRARSLHISMADNKRAAPHSLRVAACISPASTCVDEEFASSSGHVRSERSRNSVLVAARVSPAVRLLGFRP